MLLQRLATGATGVNKRDTGEGLLGAVRHSYAHAQYIHNEFRRGFCTLLPSARMRSEGTVVSVCLSVCLSVRAISRW